MREFIIIKVLVCFFFLFVFIVHAFVDFHKLTRKKESIVKNERKKSEGIDDGVP